MGRKVHPIGFRLGVNKTWESRWFANPDKYADQLHEDREVRELIHKAAPRAGISRIDIERFPNKVQITVHTAKPGIVIGRKGATVKLIRRDIQELTGTSVKLDVEEISNPDLDARLVAENIANQLERRISHRRAMQRAMHQAMRRVPAQTLRADLDFARAEALTTYGRIGVKVWIYKGEILPDAEDEQEAMDVYVSE